MREHHPWKFTALFVCLLVALVCRPFVLHEGLGRWIFLGTMTVIFIAAIRSLSDEKWQRWVALGLGIACIGLRWADAINGPWKGIAFDVVTRLFEMGFFLLGVTMLIVAIFRRGTITLDNIMGAFAGYLLIALTFGIVFSLVELTIPGSFHANDALQAEWHQPQHREWLLGYFSCCTLMTIGYGDITPVHPAARTLSILEGMTGQLYLAVLVAVLVGAKVAQAHSTVNQKLGEKTE